MKLRERRIFRICLTTVMVVSSLAVISLYSQAHQIPQSESSTQLPEGDGRELVVNLCSPCHTLERVTGQRKSADKWKETVEEMIARGAQILPDEADTISGYLGKYLAPEKAQ